MTAVRPGGGMTAGKASQSGTARNAPVVSIAPGAPEEAGKETAMYPIGENRA